MPYPALAAAITQIGRAVQCHADHATDGRLLTRFVQTQDESAFAALVHRLGPMVLGVCRRVAGDRHLADDAFQATFIVLARRAADVRPREAIRGWLYGVAVRTAREARSMSARRRAREMPVPSVPDRPAESAEVPDADALRMLDEEIAALPEHLRVAVVLCELDGVSRKHAAARLNVPEGTLSSRLAKARKALAERLRNRGISLPAAGLAVLTSTTTVSARLALTTSALATSADPVPPGIAALTNGVFRTMLFQKLTVAGITAFFVTVCATLAIAGRFQPDEPAALFAEEPQKPPIVFVRAQKKEFRAAAKPAGPGRLLLTNAGACWVLTPDGKKISELPIPEHTGLTECVCFSPDGTRAAFVVGKKEGPRADRNNDDPWPLQVVVRNLDKLDAAPAVWDLPALRLRLCWTADGKRLIAVKQSNFQNPDSGVENLLCDPDTGKTEPLDLPAGVHVVDAGKDGKTFLVVDGRTKKRRLGIATTGNAQIRALTDVKGWSTSVIGRFSPDGTKVLFLDADPERKNAYRWGWSERPYVLDLKTGNCNPLAEFPINGRAKGVAWSPDGKRLAYTWYQLHDEILKKKELPAPDAFIETEAFLVIADADGKNPKTVASGRGPHALSVTFGRIDWR